MNIIPNKIYIFLIIILTILSVLIYNYLWQPLLLDNELDRVFLYKKECYLYKDDNDLLSVAKYATSKKYGEDEILKQRVFYLEKLNYKNQYIVYGKPNGFIKQFTSKFVNPVVVDLKLVNNKCIVVVDIFKEKD